MKQCSMKIFRRKQKTLKLINRKFINYSAKSVVCLCVRKIIKNGRDTTKETERWKLGQIDKGETREGDYIIN